MAINTSPGTIQINNAVGASVDGCAVGCLAFEKGSVTPIAVGEHWEIDGAEAQFETNSLWPDGSIKSVWAVVQGTHADGKTHLPLSIAAGAPTTLVVPDAAEQAVWCSYITVTQYDHLTRAKTTLTIPLHLPTDTVTTLITGANCIEHERVIAMNANVFMRLTLRWYRGEQGARIKIEFENRNRTVWADTDQIHRRFIWEASVYSLDPADVLTVPGDPAQAAVDVNAQISYVNSVHDIEDVTTGASISIPRGRQTPSDTRLSRIGVEWGDHRGTLYMHAETGTPGYEYASVLNPEDPTIEGGQFAPETYGPDDVRTDSRGSFGRTYNFVGGHDPSTGLLPEGASGGDNLENGPDTYIMTADGNVGGTSVITGDMVHVRPGTASPSNTSFADWTKGEPTSWSDNRSAESVAIMAARTLWIRLFVGSVVPSQNQLNLPVFVRTSNPDLYDAVLTEPIVDEFDRTDPLHDQIEQRFKAIIDASEIPETQRTIFEWLDNGKSSGPIADPRAAIFWSQSLFGTCRWSNGRVSFSHYNQFASFWRLALRSNDERWILLAISSTDGTASRAFEWKHANPQSGRDGVPAYESGNGGPCGRGRHPGTGHMWIEGHVLAYLWTRDSTQKRLLDEFQVTLQTALNPVINDAPAPFLDSFLPDGDPLAPPHRPLQGQADSREYRTLWADRYGTVAGTDGINVTGDFGSRGINRPLEQGVYMAATGVWDLTDWIRQQFDTVESLERQWGRLGFWMTRSGSRANDALNSSVQTEHSYQVWMMMAGVRSIGCAIQSLPEVVRPKDAAMYRRFLNNMLQDWATPHNDGVPGEFGVTRVMSCATPQSKRRLAGGSADKWKYNIHTAGDWGTEPVLTCARGQGIALATRLNLRDVYLVDRDNETKWDAFKVLYDFDVEALVNDDTHWWRTTHFDLVTAALAEVQSSFDASGTPSVDVPTATWDLISALATSAFMTNYDGFGSFPGGVNFGVLHTCILADLAAFASIKRHRKDVDVLIGNCINAVFYRHFAGSRPSAPGTVLSKFGWETFANPNSYTKVWGTLLEVWWLLRWIRDRHLGDVQLNAPLNQFYPVTDAPGEL